MKSFMTRIKSLEERVRMSMKKGLEELSDVELDQMIFDLYKKLESAGELTREEAREIELSLFRGQLLFSGAGKYLECQAASEICTQLLAMGVEKPDAAEIRWAAAKEQAGQHL